MARHGALVLLGGQLSIGGLFGRSANPPHAGTPQHIAVAGGIDMLAAAVLLAWRLTARARG